MKGVRTRRWGLAVASGAVAVALLCAGGYPDDAAARAPHDMDGADRAAVAQQVAVPAYFYPGADWTRLTAGAPTVGITIANPASGPGGSRDENHADAIEAAHDAGIKVIGYVRTGYFGTTGIPTNDGQTTFEAWTEQIEAEIDTWYEFYGDVGLDGIFFDETLADCGSGDEYVDLYVEIANHVRRYGSDATVVDNPGAAVEQCYTRAADTLVTFEGSYATYATWKPPAWQASADPDQLWHLVYDTPGRTNLADAITLSKARNAGYVYVTPDVLDNPWDTLPAGDYWTDELSLAGAG